MAISQKRIEALGDCYVDPNCTDKRVWLRAINTFLNKSKGFNPNLEKLNNEKIRRASHKRWLLPYFDNLGWKEIDIDFFYLNREKFLINCKNGGKEVALLIDKNGDRHLLRRSNWYGGASEISERLRLSTLKKLYEIFVSDVVTPTAPIRQRKMLSDRIQFISNKLENIVRYDKCANNAFRLTWLNNFSYDKVSEVMKFQSHSLLLSPTRLDCSLESASCQYRGFIECNSKLNQLTNYEKTSKLITQKEARHLIEEHYNEVKMKIDVKMEAALSHFI